MEVERNHLLHAVFDHLRGEEVGFSLLVDGDLPEVLQQDGADGLGGVGHVDGAVVAHHLAHVGQRPAVVQVEMTGEGPEEAVSSLTSENVSNAANATAANLMITQSRKSVRRPFCVTYEKSGKRLCEENGTMNPIISAHRITRQSWKFYTSRLKPSFHFSVDALVAWC